MTIRLMFYVLSVSAAYALLDACSRSAAEALTILFVGLLLVPVGVHQRGRFKHRGRREGDCP